MGRRLRTAGVALVVSGVLATAVTGCGAADRTRSVLRTAVAETSSAVAVGRLVVGLVEDDRTATTTADTVLLDVIDDVGVEQTSLAAAVPTDPGLTAARDEVARAVADASAALADARAWVAGTSGSDPAAVRDRLGSAAERLDELAETWGAS